VIAASLVLLALVAGIVGTTLGLLEVRRQERIAVAESQAKDQARQEEILQRQRAEKRLGQIEKANEVLGSIFKDLDPGSAEKEGKPLSALLGERLDQATAQVEGEAIGDPLAVARMQQTLGESQLGLGYSEKAIDLFTKARATFTVRLGPDHPDTLMSMNNLAVAYRAAGKPDRALPLLEEALALARSRLGLDHPDTLKCMNNLAVAYQANGKLDRALPLFEETFALRRSRLGPDHIHTLMSMKDLAMAYQAAGKLDRSIPLFEVVLKLRTAKSGADHPETIDVKASLGVNYRDAGRLEEAIRLLEEATLASRRHARLGWVKAVLLETYLRAGRNDKAGVLARELLAEARTEMPADSAPLAGMLAGTGSVLLQAKAWAEAEHILREALAFREAKEPDAWTTFNTKSVLGGALLGQKRYNDAEPLLRAGYEGMKQRADKIPPPGKVRLVKALDRLIALAEATGKPDDVKRWKDEKAKLPGVSAPKPEAKTR
jgi:tetratricopeptide (TPR) repeat protein